VDDAVRASDRAIVLAGLCLGLSAGVASAGQSVCWIQNGVLLVPAVAAGINGVFILDTGAARSQLDATQASEVDIGEATTRAEVRVAGRRFASVQMQIVGLDDRTRAFPTPISGVLGADILAGQVLEVRPSPCRLSLTPSGAGRRRGLLIELRGGAPFVRAGVSDGVRTLVGAFRIDTGSPAPATLGDGSLTEPSHRLRALSLGGQLFEDVTAIPRTDTGDGAAGALGEPIWSQFAMRLDFGARTLTLTPRPPAL
jgi:hypothetical protein